MTDVKPLISVATYVDDDTGVEVYQAVTGKVSTTLLLNASCMLSPLFSKHGHVPFSLAASSWVKAWQLMPYFCLAWKDPAMIMLD